MGGGGKSQLVGLMAGESVCAACGWGVSAWGVAFAASLADVVYKTHHQGEGHRQVLRMRGQTKTRQSRSR
jgi:heme exporter protein D